MNKVFIIWLLVWPFVLPAQIPVLRSEAELVHFQKNLKAQSANAIIWGKFEGWLKYWRYHDAEFENQLDPRFFHKITSSVGITLFSDTTKSYMPLSKPSNERPHLKQGDIMKMQIRLFKCCAKVGDMPFFLIEKIWIIDSPLLWPFGPIVQPSFQ